LPVGSARPRELNGSLRLDRRSRAICAITSAFDVALHFHNGGVTSFFSQPAAGQTTDASFGTARLREGITPELLAPDILRVP
jgi:hypothetical protein